MKKRVYIAGKVKDLPADEVRAKFAAAEKFLTDAGYKCFNPFAFIEKLNESRVDFGLHPLKDDNKSDREIILRICTSELLKCESIYFLPDWTDSKGSIYEKLVAEMTGIYELQITKWL